MSDWPTKVRKMRFIGDVDEVSPSVGDEFERQCRFLRSPHFNSLRAEHSIPQPNQHASFCDILVDRVEPVVPLLSSRILLHLPINHLNFTSPSPPVKFLIPNTILRSPNDNFIPRFESRKSP